MKTRYKKSEAVKTLERLADLRSREKYPNMPDQYRAPKKYRDKSSNELTKCIIHWIRYNHYQAERINVTGRLKDNTRVVSDVLGYQREIGSKQWMPTSGQRGSSDISATIKGKSVKIEVKIADKQSEHQVQYQKSVELAGGIYFLARNFEEFLEFYKNLLS